MVERELVVLAVMWRFVALVAAVWLRVLAVAWSPARHPRGSRGSGLSAAKDPEDLIERLFGFFFGAVEEEPMGLKRMSVEKFPDQYPADVSGRRAAPLATDDPAAAAYVRPVLVQTFLETRAIQCLYDADRDGWDARAWHARVDRRGPGVVLCEAADGQIFGGYNSKGWVGLGENRPGLANFLFSWEGDDDFVKLRKVGGAGMATSDLPELGPSFGAEGLVVPLRPDAAGGPRVARVKLGAYYARMPGTDAKTFLHAGANAVQLKSMRGYFGMYDDSDDVPFDDALPFSIT